MGSNETVKVGNQYVRARQYPWGVVQGERKSSVPPYTDVVCACGENALEFFLSLSVENENHCDFKKLRDSLIEKNMLDLIETTHSKHYENFRRNRLTDLGLTDNIDGKQISISDTLTMKRNELREELEKREQQLKESFIQKVKGKEIELKDAEKQVRDRWNILFDLHENCF